MFFQELIESISDQPDFSFQAWFRSALFPACPCPGCHETFCRKFNSELTGDERLTLIQRLVERLNKEDTVGGNTNEGLDVIMLLCNWQFWQDTGFHIYFPLFLNPLGRQYENLKDPGIELDSIIRNPIDYFWKSKELGVSEIILDNFLVSASRAAREDVQERSRPLRP